MYIESRSYRKVHFLSIMEIEGLTDIFTNLNHISIWFAYHNFRRKCLGNTTFCLVKTKANKNHLTGNLTKEQLLELLSDILISKSGKVSGIQMLVYNI